MSLTSYRAAPPRVGFVCVCVVCVLLFWRLAPGVWWLTAGVGLSGRPGGDRLSRVLGRSTMGAGGFHGRVRDGIGWSLPAKATRSSSQPWDGCQRFGCQRSGGRTRFWCGVVGVRGGVAYPSLLARS